MNDSPTQPSPDSSADRVKFLTKRAAQAGYRLTLSVAPPYTWTLLDAEDNEPIYSASTIDAVEQWLNT